MTISLSCEHYVFWIFPYGCNISQSQFIITIYRPSCHTYITKDSPLSVWIPLHVYIKLYIFNVYMSQHIIFSFLITFRYTPHYLYKSLTINNYDAHFTWKNSVALMTVLYHFLSTWFNFKISMKMLIITIRIHLHVWSAYSIQNWM